MKLVLKISEEHDGFNLEKIEKNVIVFVLIQNNWHQKRSAPLLGLSPRALNYKINLHGITHNHWRRNRSGPFVAQLTPRKIDPLLRVLQDNGLTRRRGKLLISLARNSFRVDHSIRQMSYALIAMGFAKLVSAPMTRVMITNHSSFRGKPSRRRLQITNKGCEVAKQLLDANSTPQRELSGLGED